MIGRTVDELAVGDSAELVRTVTADDVAAFVGAVGDDNPVHSDLGYAATTPFAVPIAPGIFTAGLISAVIGTRLPGPGSIYLSQTLKFVKPVKPGDSITARVEVVERLPERNRIRLRTVCTNDRGDEVLLGEAWVLPPRTPVRYEPSVSPGATLTALSLAPWAWAARAAAWWGAVGLAMLAPTSMRRA
jgi:acyl dehydratase